MKFSYSLYTVLMLLILGACSYFPANVSHTQDSSALESSQTTPALTQLSNETTLQAEGGRLQAVLKDEPTEEENFLQDSEIEVPFGFEKSESDFNADASSNKTCQTKLDEALELCQESQERWQKGELENAVEALDRAYALILDTDASEDPKFVQQKEDLRFMISKRILEIYASRNIVVNGNHKAIPIVSNGHVQAEIDLFTKGAERQYFIESYKRSGKYRNQIVAALEESGLPEELSWLPLIESGYKVNALSPARALGLWQFIPSTGYKFGLRRDKFIDERMDPEKSTKAAIDYLRELHQIFGDWSTVLAAYNCGEVRVLSIIRNQNVNYLDNFWDLYERLPRETARYVPRFLATLHIVNNLAAYGLEHILPDPPLEFETVAVDRQMHLKQIANAIGTEEDRLTELNPELRYKILPADNYRLKVPRGSRDLLLASINQIPKAHLQQRAVTYHRVQRGESLSVIARKYRTSVDSIRQANNLNRSQRIVAGKSLKIPQKGYSHETPETSATARKQSQIHLVKKGDSLYKIAKLYGTTTKKIQELNNLQSTLLQEGQQLRIYSAKEPSSAATAISTYTVRPGDTPIYIAKRHNMELNRLLHINRLYPQSKIYPGQKLYIE
jgi:membrane-bound lytic murein transglycosylase D